MNRPLRTLIVDDEPLAVERLQILCARVPGLVLVGTAGDGAAALRMADALEPDLLFLDIAMPGMTGLEVAAALDGRPRRPALVFVTAYDQFAVAAFDAAAVDYLLKPVAPDRLQKAVDRVRAALAAADQATAIPPPPANGADSRSWAQEFWVPNRGELIRVGADQIDCIEAERDYMRLHVGLRSYLIHETIGALEQRLDPARFIRLHRSTIVRRDLVERLSHDGQGNWTASLSTGTDMKIGRTYLASVRAAITRG